MNYHNTNTLETMKEVESEIIRFQSILKDAKEKANVLLEQRNEHVKWNNDRNNTSFNMVTDISILSTKESSALKSSWKSMKYKLDKLIL